MIPEHIWKAKWPEVELHHSGVRPVAYGSASVQILGKANVIVSCKRQDNSADIFVVELGKYSLFDCDLLSHLSLHLIIIKNAGATLLITHVNVEQAAFVLVGYW